MPRTINNGQTSTRLLNTNTPPTFPTNRCFFFSLCTRKLSPFQWKLPAAPRKILPQYANRLFSGWLCEHILKRKHLFHTNQHSLDLNSQPLMNYATCICIGWKIRKGRLFPAPQGGVLLEPTPSKYLTTAQLPPPLATSKFILKPGRVSLFNFYAPASADSTAGLLRECHWGSDFRAEGRRRKRRGEMVQIRASDAAPVLRSPTGFRGGKTGRGRGKLHIRASDPSFGGSLADGFRGGKDKPEDGPSSCLAGRTPL